MMSLFVGGGGVYSYWICCPQINNEYYMLVKFNPPLNTKCVSTVYSSTIVAELYYVDSRGPFPFLVRSKT